MRDPKATDIENVYIYYKQAIGEMAKKTLDCLSVIKKIFTPEHTYRNRSIYSLYFVALVNGLGLALLLPISALFLEEYYSQSPGSIALIIGVIGALSILGSPIGGVLSDKFGTKPIVVITMVLGGLNMIILGIEYSIVVLVILFTMRRFIFAIMQPSFRSLQSNITPEVVRGKEFGIAKSFDNLGAVIGPILGGFLYDVYAPMNFYINEMHYFGTGIVFSLSGMIAIIGGLVIFTMVDDNSQSPKPSMDPVQVIT